MASATFSEKAFESVEVKQSRPVHMESVARFMNIPIVKLVAEVVTTAYAKMKDNSATNKTLTSAETFTKNAFHGASFILETFQKPIAKVDNFLCSGLDYVEKNFSAVTSHPNQMLNYISETRPAKMLCNLPKFGKLEIVDISSLPRVQLAFSEIKPFFTSNANPQNWNVFDFIAQKINELLHSAVTQEIANKDNAESIKPVSDKSQMKESQPEESSTEEQKARPKAEGIAEKVNVEKES